jgi:hypothetical protein
VVIDAVTWFAEDDMFRLRLQMLGPLVDLFVVVEADVTHQGDAKPLRFPDDLRDNPKVRWTPVTLTAGSPWGRENEQRRLMKDAVAGVASDADIVVFSDCDEIWDGRLVDGLTNVCAARMDFRLFSLLWRYQSDWAGSIAGPWWKMREQDWQALRDRRWELPSRESGWHFSWMGDDEARLVKQQSFAHSEFGESDLSGPVAAGRWLNGREMEETHDGLPEGLTNIVPRSWVRQRVD